MNQICKIGWDIGGAHLKAVMVDANGFVLAVSQVYCPLWRGLLELNQAMDKVLSEFNANKYSVTHFVTMTGELADVFSSRHAGVMQIAQFVTKKLSADEVMFYAGNKGFVEIAVVEAESANIASMNWLASVQYLAENRQQALFIDIGSTTTDIALISNGKPCVLGFNDAARMRNDELVYTGVVRTPLMALAQKILFEENLINVAAENFATTADVYTLTGDLSVADNMAETADGAEKSIEASARRIARMIGMDAQDAPLTTWQDLASAFKHVQLHQIKQAMLRQVSLLEDSSDLYVIGAGVGDFLVFELATQLGLKYESIANLIAVDNNEVRKMAAVCFPAYAVASMGRVKERQC